MSPRTGRPPLPEDERRDVRLVVRLNKAELELLTVTAGDVQVATWLRNLGLAAGAGQELPPT